MAELHLSGQIAHATGFPGNNLFCEWGLAISESWEVLQGSERGRTQVDAANGAATWAHPIEIHLLAKGLSSWPKLHFQVWSRLSNGGVQIRGYGFCHVPTTPGVHSVACSTWRPLAGVNGSSTKSVAAGDQLRYDNIVHSGEDRFRLQTASSGTVHLELNLLMRSFHRHHVQLA